MDKRSAVHQQQRGKSVESLNDDITAGLVVVTWVPLMLFGTYQLQTQTIPTLNPRTLAILYTAAASVSLVFLTVSLIRKTDLRQKCREGLTGEMATAQLLEPIIVGGGRVLHDIQAPGFNIDHVVEQLCRMPELGQAPGRQAKGLAR